MQKAKRIHNPCLLLQQKTTKTGKKCTDFGYSNTFYISEGTATDIYFLKISLIEETK